MTEDQERCMKLAKPMLGDFYEIWHHAFDNYQEYPVEFTAEHDDTTAANCIRAHAWTDSSGGSMAKTATSCIVSGD